MILEHLGNGHCINDPPPPQWFWEQGKMTFCSIFGIKPTMEQVFPVRAS